MLWILFILLICVLIWFSSVRIKFFYKREAENDRIKVEIGLLNGLIPIKKEFSSLKLKQDGAVIKEKQSQKIKKKKITMDEVKKASRQFNQIKDRVVHFNRIIKRFMAKTKVKKINWWSRIGTGDAAETGVLSGLLWGVKSSLVMGVCHFLKIKTRPSITVEPSFMQACFYTELECIVQFRVGDAILAGISFLINWKKGRGAKWQSTQFKA